MVRRIALVPMCADPLHHGHINIIKIARGLVGHEGLVLIALVGDGAIIKQKGKVLLPFNHRKTVLLALADVDIVCYIKYYTFAEAVSLVQPHYVVHGDDWADPQAALYEDRCVIRDLLVAWGGCLVEPAYTKGMSSTWLKNNLAPTNL